MNTIVAYDNFLLQNTNRRRRQSLRKVNLRTIFVRRLLERRVRLFFVILAVTALIFLYLWQDAALLRLKLQLATIEEQITEIEAENYRLEFQVQQAFSLERISTFARQHLKMIEPTDIRYIIIDPSSDE